jgi:hypothetical protein
VPAAHDGFIRRYLELDVELIDALEREMAREQALPSEHKGARDRSACTMPLDRPVYYSRAYSSAARDSNSNATNGSSPVAALLVG